MFWVFCCCIGNCFFCSHRATEFRLGLAHSMKSQSNCFWTLWDRGSTFLNSFCPKIHPFRVEMTQGICGCWLFSQISLRPARPPTIRQPPLKNATRARREKREKKCLGLLVIIFNFYMMVLVELIKCMTGITNLVKLWERSIWCIC